MINGTAPLPAGGAYLAWGVLALAAGAILRSRRHRRTRWQWLALALVWAASAAAFALVSWGRATPFGDFNKAYYPAGSLVFHDPDRLYACSAGNLCFVNLPIIAALFAPLSMLPLRLAQIVFTAVGLASIAAAALLLMKELRATATECLAILALVALNGPLLYSVRLGNLTHVLLPVLIVALACLANGRDRLGGALLAALAVIKPPFLLFLPYLVARARLRAAAAFAIVVACVAALSVAMFGIPLHRVWLADFIGPYSQGIVGAYNVQSVSGMLAHLVRPGNLTNWSALAVSPGFAFARILLLGGAAAALVWTHLPAPSDREETYAEFGAVLVLMLLASPITWTHYYAFCLIPLTALVVKISHARERGAMVPAGPAIGAALLISAPVVLALPAQPLARLFVERVLISHFAIGGIALAGTLAWVRIAVPSRARAAAPEPAAASVLPYPAPAALHEAAAR